MTRLFEIGLIGRIFCYCYFSFKNGVTLHLNKFELHFFHWCSAPSFVEIYSLVLEEEMITLSWWSFVTECFGLRWSKSNHRFWSRLFRKGTVVCYLTFFSCKRMLYSFEHTLNPHRNKFCDERSILEKIWTYKLNIFVCCLFWFFSMETLWLPVKGCTCWPMLGTHSHWAMRVLKRAIPLSLW